MVILPEAYGSSLEIKNVSQARVSPLAQLLLSFPEIRSVNMNSTSFSIAKKPSVSWEYIDSVLDEKLDKFFEDDAAVITVYEPKDIPEDPNLIKESDCEVVKLVKEVLQTRIRPRVVQDGGDILFDSWLPETGEVVVRMIGACEDCPSSSITLKQGVEKMLMHYIPEVKRVLNKGDEELPLEERERQSNAERKEMEYLDNFNKELDRMIAEEKARIKEEAKKKLEKS